MEKIIKEEEQRLVGILKIAQEYIQDRAKTLRGHDVFVNEIKTERLESVNWAEKNDLTEKLIEQSKFDPRKYLVPYESIDSPYFGIFQILDDNKKIGRKTYCIGPQTLTLGSKIYVLDWRSEVSKIFYEFDVAEEYDAEIQGIERTGRLEFKRKVTIAKKKLIKIETDSETLELDGETWKIGKHAITTTDQKLSAEDHHLIDIITLISPDQFREISKAHIGCTYLTGSAGSGKTTVALHNLSYKQFNDPTRFDPKRCLVVMFNRTLKEYVKSTSEKLLGDTRVETFNSWILLALQSYKIAGISIKQDTAVLEKIKRSITVQDIEQYVGASKGYNESCDLWAFYVSIKNKFEAVPEYIEKCLENIQKRSKEYSFIDTTILLKILQLRSKTETVRNANNFYAHMIIDEAQDFGFLELSVLYHSCDESKSLMICADEKQHILEFVDSTGFPMFKQMVLTNRAEKTNLQLSYRSSKAVAKLSSQISGREVVTSNPKDGKVEFIKTNSEREAIVKLREKCTELVTADSRALIAVICKRKADCPRLASELRSASGLTNVREISRCEFTPGIIVANAHQVKGLEFTHVILWNPSVTEFRETTIDTNLLYVSVTRACDTLTILHYSELSKVFKI